MYGTVEQRDGVWYILVTSGGYFNPVYETSGYKITEILKADGYAMSNAPVDGERVRYDIMYQAYYNAERHLVYHTEEKNSLYETTPMARPKVRRGVKIRYNRGRWEKYAGGIWTSL